MVPQHLWAGSPHGQGVSALQELWSRDLATSGRVKAGWRRSWAGLVRQKLKTVELSLRRKCRCENLGSRRECRISACCHEEIRIFWGNHTSSTIQDRRRRPTDRRCGIRSARSWGQAKAFRPWGPAPSAPTGTSVVCQTRSYETLKIKTCKCI